MSTDKTTRWPKYVIISDADAPQPSMVCQWIPGVGYCYLDRRGNKPTFDGMRGDRATPIEAFGFDWTEDGGKVRFEMTSHPCCTATYQDGEPRRWQSTSYFFWWAQLKPSAIRELATDAR